MPDVAVGLVSIKSRNELFYDSESGFGFVDGDKAVQMVLDSSPTSNALQPASSYQGQDIVVAVIDTGFDLEHPDLAGKFLVNTDEVANDNIDNDNNSYVDDYMGFNFVSMNNVVTDHDGHGTHVVGRIVAHNPSKGIFGVAYESKILAIKGLYNKSTDALYVGYKPRSIVAEAIRYAVDQKARIINLSLTLPFEIPEIVKALEYANSHGVLVFAAAGNDGKASPKFPANNNLTIPIGNGYNRNHHTLALSSNLAGPGRKDFFTAPGQFVLSTTPNNTYSYKSGTSMAAPYVAGIASRMLSANPNLTKDDVLNILAHTATRLPMPMLANSKDLAHNPGKSSSPTNNLTNNSTNILVPNNNSTNNLVPTNNLVLEEVKKDREDILAEFATIVGFIGETALSSIVGKTNRVGMQRDNIINEATHMK
jgi:subtilisin family serine protease